jgi:MFS family permease
MTKQLHWYDYILINSNWFAITARSQILTPLVIPLLVQQFVGEEMKGTYYGSIRLWSLMVALLVQALMGLLSDRSTMRWGRRRPFIVIGALGEVVMVILMGLTTNLEGMTGYWVLFALYIGSMVTSNTSHAATQGLIPDLVPEEKRGLASGVKALLELPLPLIVVSLTAGKLIGGGNLWGGLMVLVAVLIVCMLVTLPVREHPQQKAPFEIDWQPFIRLVIMTGVFTMSILSVGASVKAVVNLMLGTPVAASTILAGLAGVIGMALAIVLGVSVSTAIGIGRAIGENKSFVWWVINRLAFLVAATNLSGFTVYFLQERFEHLQGEAAGGPASTLIMVIGIFILLTALPGGWLADRLGKKRVLVACGLLGVAGVSVIVLIPALPAVYVGGCLVGMAAGLFYSANWALGTALVPEEQAGRYLGLSNLAGAGAGAIGAYIGGPIADSVGYVTVFVIYGVLFALSVLALIGIEEHRPALQEGSNLSQ